MRSFEVSYLAFSASNLAVSAATAFSLIYLGSKEVQGKAKCQGNTHTTKVQGKEVHGNDNNRERQRVGS